jgi:hypothetical protein
VTSVCNAEHVVAAHVPCSRAGSSLAPPKAVWQAASYGAERQELTAVTESATEAREEGRLGAAL